MPILNVEDVLEIFFPSDFDVIHPNASDYNPFAWDLPNNGTGLFTDGHYDSISLFTAFHKVSHFVTTIIGGMCSITLFYLVLFHCKGVLGQYGRMLLLCCVCDLTYWLVESLVNVKTKVNDGCLIARLEGVTKFTSYNSQAFFTSLYAMQLTMMVTILPSQYFYRYWSVCNSEPLSAWQTFGLYCISLFFAIILAVLAYPSYRFSGLARPDFNYGTLWYKEQPLPPLMIADFSSVYAQRYLIYCVSAFIVSYGICLILAIKTVRLMAENEQMYSSKTKRMQKQLTITLTLQTLMPLFISFGPVVCVCIGCFFRVDTGVMSLVVLGFASWIPVVNPVLTIWVIQPFRRTVFRWLYIKVGGVISQESSSVKKTTNGRPTTSIASVRGFK
ncbi:unnamed protein product [Bursaphelenchus xylophilus]|uniref:(pine wood nematode) hypothetical protein n=1 Tax=Bursaphelenchus xylophilus TaxID=6326 RepID=A0A1I7S1M4_BURXY|nr:unnamed protein product [Bursaphelenchus xylophilus]CAG9081263.1 unnamed protein product [Bursaphelenchus xylophilus]